MKINVLDKSIFNRIAAGEVVERPASIVKELVENSIDANATQIEISILNGGISRIKVSDNGSGMDFDNLPLAFLPHATSKIATLDDLDKIGTLGFRGEALSSIASVAKVIAISKVESEELGSKIEIHGGEVISHTQMGATTGTTITVDEIFYCVPARAKFLKKPKQEESEVTNIVARLILANPLISIKYIVDNKIIFLSQGNGLLEAVYIVYGKTTTDNLLEVNYKRDFFEITGYIGKPTFTKPNRTYQTLLINNRYVINNTVSTAAYKAFEGFLMKGNFPFYVLNISIPLDKVDVNVHPNKLDVKFEESNKIFGIILSAISNVLLETSHVKTLDNNEDELISFTTDLNLQNLNENEGKSFADNMQNGLSSLNEVSLENNNSNENNNISFDVINGLKRVTHDPQVEQKRNEFKAFTSGEINFNDLQINQDYGHSYNIAKQALENPNIISTSNNNIMAETENLTLFENAHNKIIGTLFGTYIIVEQGEFAYFIDQHAAHERILYDKFKKQLENKEIVTQPLLVPYILDTNYQESEFINNNIEAFNELGFDIENFGPNSYKISAVPNLFKNIAINSFFALVLKDTGSQIKISASNIIEDYLARSACRTAIKANDRLTDMEIEMLLTDLNQKNQILLCPHGRPIVVKIPKTDLEKWFKRIV